jgi:hypothetical protein
MTHPFADSAECAPKHKEMALQAARPKEVVKSQTTKDGGQVRKTIRSIEDQIFVDADLPRTPHRQRAMNATV